MEVHEPSPAYNRRFVSVKEYLEQEKKSIQKNEYYKGEILPWLALETGTM